MFLLSKARHAISRRYLVQIKLVHLLSFVLLRTLVHERKMLQDDLPPILYELLLSSVL